MNSNDHSTPEQPQLSARDAHAIDRLVEAGFDRDAIEETDAQEQARIQASLELFKLLDDYPLDTGDEDLLVHATLARIRHSEEARTARMRFAEHEEAEHNTQRRWRIPVPDFISVAAIILIGVGVLWPVLGEVRARAVDAGCVANLATLGSAFQTYANEFNGNVPMQTAGWGAEVTQPRWLDPYPLVKLGYCQHGHVNCPGHTREELGYSRQLIVSSRDLRWLVGGALPVVGDRNPVLDARMRADSRFIDPQMNSDNHGKRGQNVLSMDGSVNWLNQPFVGSDDNIWLIRGSSEVFPGRIPIAEDDAFLVH